MYLLGYDIGSSSVKGALVDALTGECIASDYFPKTEAPIKAIKPGWSEQNPDSWWNYLKEVTQSILSNSNINPCEIGAIGISYQMHGLVAVDKDMNVLRDSIIWCDSRGVPYGEKAFNEVGREKCLEHILNSPGNFTASKLMWLKENEPEIYDRIYKVMLPGDYIAMKLTGEICTTPEGLSEYMLWDFKASGPARFLIDYFGFDESIFPDIRPPFSEQGRLRESAAEELGLSAGIPVTYRAGDQPNNALSLNVFNPGEVASTAGTSGVVYGINGSISYDSLSRVNNFAHVNHCTDYPRIGVMTCINGTGILNSWLRRNIVPEGMSYPEMNVLAEKVGIGSEGISVLPFGNGAERVLENREINCSIHGINFNIHNRNHILRAAQEGIVFSLYYGMEIMQGIGLSVEKIHAGNANMFLSRVFSRTLASVSGAVIQLYDTDGAIGAARGAGIGAGIYKNAGEAFASLKIIDTIYPDADRSPYIEAYRRWTNYLKNEINNLKSN